MLQLNSANETISLKHLKKNHQQQQQQSIEFIFRYFDCALWHTSAIKIRNTICDSTYFLDNTHIFLSLNGDDYMDCFGFGMAFNLIRKWISHKKSLAISKRECWDRCFSQLNEKKRSIHIYFFFSSVLFFCTFLPSSMIISTIISYHWKQVWSRALRATRNALLVSKFCSQTIFIIFTAEWNFFSLSLSRHL